MNDGGQAFPSAHTEREGTPIARVVVTEGMSLRDYFSAKAMQGNIAALAGAEHFNRVNETAKTLDISFSECLAKMSVQAADALLAMLTKGTKTP